MAGKKVRLSEPTNLNDPEKGYIRRLLKDIDANFNSVIDEFTQYRNKVTTWFDANDATTSSTPISHTGGATNTYITNDAAGSFTNQYDPNETSPLWDTATNSFDFSRLKIGDTVFFRFDFEVTPSQVNQEMSFTFDLAIGGAPYSLSIQNQHFKTTTVKLITFVYEIYMGDLNTLTYPAKVRFESDDAADIKVNGWYYRITQV